MHSSYSSLGVRLVLAGEPLFITLVLISIGVPVSDGATKALLLKIETAYYHDQLTVPRNLSPSCIENVFCHACLKTQNFT